MNKPGGSAPEAWKAGKRCYGGELTLDLCQAMLAAAEKEALRQGVPMVIAIADSGGNLMAFQRMENAILVSIQIAMDKAYTAVFGKQNTAQFGSAYRAGSLVPLFFHERWITFAGGFPLIRRGVIWGGIGVSGGISEDIFAARAALKAGRFETAEADEMISALDHPETT